MNDYTSSFFDDFTRLVVSFNLSYQRAIEILWKKQWKYGHGSKVFLLKSQVILQPEYNNFIPRWSRLRWRSTT